MPPALELADAHVALVDDYARSLAETGLAHNTEKLWEARAFCHRVGEPAHWSALSLDAQLGLHRRVRTFVAWLFITRRLAANADYLAATTHQLGGTSARHYPVFHAEFTEAAITLGFTPKTAARQWASVTNTAALHQVAPHAITDDMLDSARSALEDAYIRQRPDTAAQKSATKGFFGEVPRV